MTERVSNYEISATTEEDENQPGTTDLSGQGSGVVRDEKIRQQAIADILEFAAGQGLECVDSVDSEVHGPAGNVEHLVWLRR